MHLTQILHFTALGLSDLFFLTVGAVQYETSVKSGLLWPRLAACCDVNVGHSLLKTVVLV